MRQCPEIVPHTCDAIERDGNCLFRALSKEVTGTQGNHEAVCDAINNFMVEPANTDEFATMLFPRPPSGEESESPLTKIN